MRSAARTRPGRLEVSAWSSAAGTGKRVGSMHCLTSSTSIRLWFPKRSCTKSLPRSTWYGVSAASVAPGGSVTRGVSLAGRDGPFSSAWQTPFT